MSTARSPGLGLGCGTCLPADVAVRRSRPRHSPVRCPPTTPANFSAGSPDSPPSTASACRRPRCSRGRTTAWHPTRRSNEVHLTGTVDHHDRQQDRSAQARRHLDNRSLIGSRQLHCEHVALAYPQGLKRAGGLFRLTHQDAEGCRALAVAGHEHERAATRGPWPRPGCARSASGRPSALP